MSTLSTSESYLLSGCYNKVIRKAICILLQQAAEHGNLVLTSFVAEAKKDNPGVWISLTIDFSPKSLSFLTSPPAKAGRFSCGLLCPYPTGLHSCLLEEVLRELAGLHRCGLHRMCGRYRTPVGEAMTDRLGPSPATRREEPVGSFCPRYFCRILAAPTRSRWPSNPHPQMYSLPRGLCLLPQDGHV